MGGLVMLLQVQSPWIEKGLEAELRGTYSVNASLCPAETLLQVGLGALLHLATHLLGRL